MTDDGTRTGDVVVLGAVVCRHHGTDIDLLCSECLALTHVSDEQSALERDGERFVQQHRHSRDVPAHDWDADAIVTS